MRNSRDPDACLFGDCPYVCLIEEPDLQRILDFACESIEHQGHAATRDRPEQHLYQRKPDRFEAACRMFEIPPGEPMRRARVWVDLVARAAMDAHENIPMAGRGRPDGEVRRVAKKEKKR